MIETAADVEAIVLQVIRHNPYKEITGVIDECIKDLGALCREGRITDAERARFQMLLWDRREQICDIFLPTPTDAKQPRRVRTA